MSKAATWSPPRTSRPVRCWSSTAPRPRFYRERGGPPTATTAAGLFVTLSFRVRSSPTSSSAASDAATLPWTVITFKKADSIWGDLTLLNWSYNYQDFFRQHIPGCWHFHSQWLIARKDCCLLIDHIATNVDYWMVISLFVNYSLIC